MSRIRRIAFAVTFLLAAALICAWLSYSLSTRNRPSPVAAIQDDLDALSSRFHDYRAEFGEFPPNYADGADAVARHLKKRFPLHDDEPPPPFDAADTVVFWLGGFSTEPRHPLTGAGGPLATRGSRNEGLYEFDSWRLVEQPSGYSVYLPPGRGMTEPYVYFNTSGSAELAHPGDAPRVRPYRESAVRFVRGDSFQLLSAGPDNDWGSQPPPFFPAGPFIGGHADNVTNFSLMLGIKLEP